MESRFKRSVERLEVALVAPDVGFECVGLGLDAESPRPDEAVGFTRGAGRMTIGTNLVAASPGHRVS